MLTLKQRAVLNQIVESAKALLSEDGLEDMSYQPLYELVATSWSITTDELLSSSRKEHIVKAKWCLYHIMHHKLYLNCQDISIVVPYKPDRQTIKRGIAIFQHWLDLDDKLVTQNYFWVNEQFGKIFPQLLTEESSTECATNQPVQITKD